MSKKRKRSNRIIIDSEIHFGKPCVAGSRIPVKDVLELVEEGVSFDEIRENFYRDLEIDDIKACVHYATEIVNSEEVMYI